MISKFIRCAVALVCLAIGAPALATVPPAPLGLDIDGKEFDIAANKGWTFSKDGGATFSKVRVTRVIKEAFPGAINATDRQQHALIWASSCKSSKQILTFRRKYFLPGRPKTFGAEFFDQTSDVAPANRAITSVKIYINGALAISAPGAYVHMLVAERPVLAKLFKFGTNTIDVVVVKRTENGDFGKCINGNPPGPEGIYFSLRGKYEADLWLSNNSTVSNVQWLRARTQTFEKLGLGIKPLNKGPSGLYKGSVRLEVSADEIAVDLPAPVTVTGEGLRNCVVTHPYPQRAVLDCEIFELSASQEPRALFYVFVKFPEDFQVSHVTISRTGSTYTYDPKSLNNGKLDEIYFCSATATNPNCPPP